MPRGAGDAASPSSPDELKASLTQLLRPRPLPPDPDRPPARPRADRPPSFHFLPHTLISPRPSPPQVQQQPPPPPLKVMTEAYLRNVRVPVPRNLPPGPWEPLEMSTPLLPEQRNPQVPVSAPEDVGNRKFPQDSGSPGNRWRHHRDDAMANKNQKYDNRWHSDFAEREERSAANRRAGYEHGGPVEYGPMQNTYQSRYGYEKKHMKRGDLRQHNVNWQKGPQGSAEKQKSKVEGLAVKQKLQVGGSNQQELDVHKSVHDLVPVDSGDVNSSDEKGEEIEVFSSEGDASQEDASPERQANSLENKDDYVHSRVNRDSQTAMLEHVGSNSLEGEQSSSCHMRNRRCIECRPDIASFTPEFISLYKSLIPDGNEMDKQNQLLRLLRKSINNEWPNAKLHLYGSCVNSFGFSNSDIDICLETENSNMSKHGMLLKLADLLQLENFQDVKAITCARVPIVKMTDPKTGISCDICINNLLAVINTKLLRDYSLIDERLHQLVFIVKHWARNRKVNETYRGTLSSYAYVLMCINFLQLRRPAILPCLQNMEATFELTVEDIECAYFNQVDKIQNFGGQNKESIAQLVWGFFQYWAYYHDYRNDVISVRTGTIISKQMKNWTTRVGNDRHLLSIEDPFDTSHDLGRVVSRCSLGILRKEFERAADLLQHDPNPCVTLVEQYEPSQMRNLRVRRNLAKQHKIAQILILCKSLLHQEKEIALRHQHQGEEELDGKQ